jgi:hypothetical protein
MAETGQSTRGLAALAYPMQPNESAARPMWSWLANGVVEVVKLSRCALRANRATRAANEAESGWPGARAGAERAAWVNLGHFITRARVAAGIGQRLTHLDLSGSDCGPARVSGATPPDRIVGGPVTAVRGRWSSISPQPPGVPVTPWWQSTLARDQGEIG